MAAYIHGRRKERSKEADAEADPFRALEVYHEIFEDLEGDRARLRRELDEERAAHEETRIERNEYKRRLVEYEAVDNDHDDTPKPRSRRRRSA